MIFPLELPYPGKYMKARGIKNGWAISHTEHDHSRFKKHSIGSIEEVVNRLKDAKCTLGPGAFKELQTSLGFHYDEGSVLFGSHTRRLFDPTTRVIFDWMHVLFVGGVFNVLVGVMFSMLQKSKRFTYAAADAYCCQWVWPVAVEAKPALLQLKPERAKIHLDEKRFKCAASEGRTLLPVLAHFVRQGLLKSTSAHHKAIADCFLSFAAFVETLEAAARGYGDADSSRALDSAFLASFKEF